MEVNVESSARIQRLGYARNDNLRALARTFLFIHGVILTAVLFLLFSKSLLFLTPSININTFCKLPPFKSKHNEGCTGNCTGERGIDAFQLQMADSMDKGEEKPSVLLLVIVSSDPRKVERRNAIRETWWTKCNKGQNEVSCFFFTDGLGLATTTRQQLTREEHENNDVIFQPVTTGMHFGLRYLFQLRWAVSKYRFEYFLRLDDDYFLCVDRLRYELPIRPKKNLFWGSYHCQFKDIIYADEAFTICTRDVAEKFLNQDENHLLCHPFADQQIAIWLQNLNVTEVHDTRIDHGGSPETYQTKRNICDKFIAVHHSYPAIMRHYWNNSNDGNKIPAPIPEVSKVCRFPKIFNYRLMRGQIYFAEPRRCNSQPSWDMAIKSWRGQENS